MSKSKTPNMKDSKSFFTGSCKIDHNYLINNLHLMDYMRIEDDDSVFVGDGFIRNAIENRFENFEYALDEKGNPDGLKNHQEMALTIADDVANKLSEIAYEKALKKLEEDDYLNVYANQLLEDYKEMKNG